MRKKSRLSVSRKPVGKSLKPISDSQIDFSDTPELSDAQLASMRRISSVSEIPDKSRRQTVTKKLKQLRRHSATLASNEIVAAIPSDRGKVGQSRARR